MLTIEEVCLLHQELAGALGRPAALRDRACLETVLARPYALRQGIPAYPTYFSKVAVIVQGLVRERPFTALNRTTALLVLALLLHRRGYRLQAEAKDVLPLLQGIAIGFTSPHSITRWIKAHATPRREGDGEVGHG